MSIIPTSILNWNFNGTPTYSNATFTGSIHVNGFLPNPYVLVFIVQLTDGTNKYIQGTSQTDPRIVIRDFSRNSIDISFNQYIGIDQSMIKFIDIGLTNPNEKVSGATGQRRFYLRLHWEPSGNTSNIYTGVLVKNRLGLYVPYVAPTATTLSTGGSVSTTTPNGLFQPPNITLINGQTMQLPCGAYTVVAKNSDGSINLYGNNTTWQFILRSSIDTIGLSANGVSNTCVSLTDPQGILGSPSGTILNPQTPLGGQGNPSQIPLPPVPQPVFNPPSTNNQPPINPNQPSGFGASIFGIILGIAAVGSLIPSGVRRLRRRRSKK